jgi:pSer/pThr/pTyr-binding forkhead associated (FHA) protein
MGVRLLVRSSWSDRTDAKYEFEFDQERIVVGRSPASDVCLPHRAVSLQHATIRVQGTRYVVQDEGSTNGTKVNGTAVASARPKALGDGDRITLGGFEIEFHGGVAVSQPTSSIRTGAIARRLVRDAIEVEAPPLAPFFSIVAGPDAGTRLEVPKPPARLVIGRAETCDLTLTDADTSREHIEVLVDLDGVEAHDLGSKNGMRVNEKPIDRRRLRDGDEISIGSTRIAFEDPAETVVLDVARSPDERVSREPVPLVPPAPEAAPPPVEAAKPPPKPPARRPSAGADWVIYALAALVLALSIAALVFLLKGP